MRARLFATMNLVLALLSSLTASSWASALPAAPPPSAVDATSPEFAARCAAAADYSAGLSGRAVLVMIGGKVVFERYDHGWSAQKPHPLASGTKSFTGVAAMLAVQDGLLTLDEKAADTLTEWKGDPLKSQITIRHLLTLSSGLDPADDLLGGRGGSKLLGPGRGARDEPQARDPKNEPANLFKESLGVKMAGKPGAQFQYGPSHYYAFGELLQRKLAASALPQKTVFDYYQARIFEPLGLRFRVGRDKAGNPKLPGGCVLTAKEWATFGQFILQNGAWADPASKDHELKTILKRDLLEECFKPSPTNKAYGLTWWLLSADGDGGEADGAGGAPAAGAGLRDRIRQRLQKNETKGVFGPDGQPMVVRMAAGKGKQRLFVLPQYDMVVVRFAEDTREGLGFSNEEFLGRLLVLKK